MHILYILLLNSYHSYIGHNVSPYYFLAVQCLAHPSKLCTRRLGYLLLSTIIPPHHTLRITAVNALLTDIRSDSNHRIHLALTALSFLLASDTIPIFARFIEDKIKASSAAVRRMAVKALLK